MATMICESQRLEDYLEESAEVDYRDPRVAELAAELGASAVDEVDYVRRVFEFVRDEVSHSWDIQSSRVTCRASEVLEHREGICYAKSNLAAALLRARKIPAGFCYQRLTLGDTPDTGYCIHAMNAVYVASLERWIRMDARGNKAGIDARFSLDEEKLAFPIRIEYDERDYDVIYAKPNAKTIDVLRNSSDCIAMYRNGLPSEL
jgi:transglutaminase-like putative cysteine protease